MFTAKYRNLKIVASLLLSIGVASCSSKTANRIEHRGPIEIKEEGSGLSANEKIETANANNLELLFLSGLRTTAAIDSYEIPNWTLTEIRQNRFELVTKIGSATTEKELVEITEPLARFVLNQSFLNDKATAGSRAMTDALNLFNQSLERLIKLYPEGAAASYYLRSFEKQIFLHCSSKLEGCTNVSFYTRNSGTANLLLHLSRIQEKSIEYFKSEAQNIATAKKTAEQNSSQQCFYELATFLGDKKVAFSCADALKRANELYFQATLRYYDYFKLGNESLNSSLNLPFFLGYIRHSADYAAWYQSLGMREKINQSAAYRTHLNFLGDTLRQLKSEKSAEYCDYLIAAKPYAYFNADRENSSNFEVISKEFIACAEKNGSLQSSIKDYLLSERDRIQTEAKLALEEVSQTDSNELIGIRDLSYYYALEFIKASPHVMKNLGIQAQYRSDLTYYIVDGIFYERLNSEIAYEYLRKMKDLDPIDFMNFTLNYVQVQIAYLLKATQINLGRSIRKNYIKYDGLSGDLFQDVADELLGLTDTEWIILKKRIDFLLDFMVKAFDAKYARGGSTKKEKEISQVYDTVRSKLSKEKLNSHIDALVTTPLMLAMSYYMAKSRNDIKVFLFWLNRGDQTISLNGKDAIARFFDPDQYALRFFRYGSERYQFDDFQKQQSFDLALRSGLFDFVPFDIRPAEKRKVEELKAKHPELASATNPAVFNEYLFFEQFFNDILVYFRTNLRSQNIELEDIPKVQAQVGLFNAACENPYNAPVEYSLNKLYMNTITGDGSFMDHMTKVYGRLGYFRYWQRESLYVNYLVRIFEAHFTSPNVELPEYKSPYRDALKSAIRSDLEVYYDLARQFMRKIQSIDKMIVNDDRDCFDRIRRAEDYRKTVLYKLNVDYYKNVHAALALHNSVPLTTQLTTDSVNDETSQSDLLLHVRNYLLQVVEDWYAKSVGAVSETDAALHGYADARRRMLDLVYLITNPDIVLNPSFTLFHRQPLTPENFGLWLANALNMTIGVQNHQDIPIASGAFSEMGVFVDDIEPYAIDRREIKRKNQLHENRFVQSRWDAFLRIRNQLKTATMNRAEAELAAGLITHEEYDQMDKSETIPIAPHTNIALQTIDELANDSLYKDTETMAVPLPESHSQTEFVMEAMGQFGGQARSGKQFVSWHSSAGASIKYLTARLSYLIRMFRIGPVEISEGDKSLCHMNEFGFPSKIGAKPGCTIYQITAKDIIDYYLKITENFKLDLTEIEILDWIGRDGRLNDQVPLYFKEDDIDDAQKWTYFDRFYRLYISKTFSVSYSGGSFKFEENDRLDGSDYYRLIFLNSMRDNFNPEDNVFPLNESVFQIQRDRVRRPILDHLRRAEELEEAIVDLEDLRIDFGPIIFERKDINAPDSRYYDFETDSFVSALDLKSNPLDHSVWRFVPLETRREAGNQPDRPDSLLYLRDDSDSIKASFYNKVRSFFVEESKCDALPKSLDPDFKNLQVSTQEALGNEALDCAVRYKLWKEDQDIRRRNERAERQEKILNGTR